MKRRRRALQHLAVGLLVPLALAVLLDRLWVRHGQADWVASLIGLTAACGLVLTPLLLHRALPRADTALGAAGITLATGLLSLLWYVIGGVIFINFHLAFGGPL